LETVLPILVVHCVPPHELDSLDAAPITSLDPLKSPIGGADNDGILPESLALVLSSSLLHTKDLFVVTIQAVKCLVSWKETVDHEESGERCS
jgi:hypothetical protein